MMTRKSNSRDKSLKQGSIFDVAADGGPKSSELMKVIAEKVPSKKKILKDFAPEEAQKILKKLEKNKHRDADDKAKEEIEDYDSQEARELRREKIRHVKRIAKEMEVGNRGRVILFPSYSRDSDKVEWYKMGNFSALYYVYRMAERMGRTPKIQVDKDRFSKMHSIVSIREIERFIESAMRLGEFDKYEVTLDGLYILYLKHELSDVDLALLRKTGAMQKEAMHTLIRPKKASPELYLTILMLSRQVIMVNEGLNGIYRHGIGDKILQDAVRLLDVYFRFTSKMISLEDTKDEMNALISGLRAGMAVLGDAELVPVVKVCAIGETIVKIEKLIAELK